jgi:hypothetical protein
MSLRPWAGVLTNGFNPAASDAAPRHSGFSTVFAGKTHQWIAEKSRRHCLYCLVLLLAPGLFPP